MTSSSVDRCIAIAAHGRRCQQSTYKGSPYCWHHTQSPKVWAPSRVTARPRPVDAPVIALRPADPSPAMPTVERIAEHLNPAQLEQLARFLESSDDGTFAVNRAHGYVEVRGAATPFFAASQVRTGT